MPSPSTSARPRFLDRLERLRLAVRPVERCHQISPQTLAVRVLGDEPFELPDELIVVPEREVGIDWGGSTAASLISSSRAIAGWAKLS